MSIPAVVDPTLPMRLPHSMGYNKHSLLLDGFEDYIDMGDTPLVDFGNGDFALEICLRITNLAQGRCAIFGKDALAPNRQFFLLWDINNDNSNALQLAYFVGGVWVRLTTGPNFLSDTSFFHHLLAQRRGDFFWIYLDGLRASSGAGVGVHGVMDAIAAKLQIGHREIIGEFLDAEIAYARIYGRSFTQRQVEYNMLNYTKPITDNLVMWLPMEEGQGLTAYDQSGNALNGTLTPAPTPPIWTDVRKWELRD